MHALVTGGAGFIGSNLVQGLLDGGDTVTVLDNLQSGHRQNLPAHTRLRLIEGDVCNAATVGEAVRDAETIFHLAASVGNKRSIDDPIADAQANVLGTINVLSAARDHGVRKVVVSSSAAVFGELRTLPIREDHPVEPDSPYGATKLCAEKLALAYAKLYPLEAVCLRYFNVYGPNQRYDAYGNAIPIFVTQILARERPTVFGDGEQTRDFVHVGDVVEANMAAARAAGVSGAFNIGSGTRVSVNALLALLGRICGQEVHVHYAPPRPGDVRDSLADIGAAQRAFGYRPVVPLEEGLRGYVTWMRERAARAGH